MTHPLVLLPGLMCDARLFGPQISAFSPGVGVAGLIEFDSVAGLAAAVLAKSSPQFALAGLSMGGIVAMEVFAQAPDRAAKQGFLDINPAQKPKPSKPTARRRSRKQKSSTCLK